ncbi:hypothetical protein BMS3Abin12_00187 [bacterium BMS3Abin12]|nr:hypothetical protein BMS3Abin12_00187 [bacterium BMS3Abin12]
MQSARRSAITRGNRITQTFDITLPNRTQRPLLNRATLNSRNSSKPPSADPNREKSPRLKAIVSPAAGKKGNGTTLQKVEAPDEVKVLEIDRRTLPNGRRYREVGFEFFCLYLWRR